MGFCTAPVDCIFLWIYVFHIEHFAWSHWIRKYLFYFGYKFCPRPQAVWDTLTKTTPLIRSSIYAAIPIGILALKTNMAMKNFLEQFCGCVNLRGSHFRLAKKLQKPRFTRSRIYTVLFTMVFMVDNAILCCITRFFPSYSAFLVICGQKTA